MNVENGTILTCQERDFQVGRFHVPTVAELRESNLHRDGSGVASTSFSINVVGNIFPRHAQSPNATFQAASQYNALEFPHPHATPEDGITDYSWDNTQGPNCALACPAGTLYRNYFVQQPDGTLGQTAASQINYLAEFLAELERRGHGGAVYIQNGYLMSNDAQRLGQLAAYLQDGISAEVRDELLKLIRAGLQDDVEVSFSDRAGWSSWTQVPRDSQIIVSQVYAAAPAITYSPVSDKAAWAPLAQLLLDAQYEATVRAAFENHKRHPGLANSNLLYLTAIGGGVFGNDLQWIVSAIRRAVQISVDEHLGLEIVLALYAPDRDFPVMLGDLVESHPSHILSG